MKKLLSLGSRQFLTGIAPSAHAESGGLFFNAVGVTPLFGAGSAASVNNGLLMAGAGGTAITIAGTPLNMIADKGVYFTSGLIIAASDNKIYKCQISDTTVPSFGATTAAITSGGTLTGGMVLFNISGADKLFYHRLDKIGNTDSDTYLSVSTDYWGAMHVHYGLNKIIFGNSYGKLGTIDSAGASSLSALTFDATTVCTALSDDGIYVVAAITKNYTGDPNLLMDTRVLFWDGSTTTGFLRDYPITDPFIYALNKTPNGVFAYGVTGIWQVTFDGVKKIFSHAPGVYTASGASVIHYGKGAVSFFSDALLWGGNVGSTNAVTALKSLGKLDSSSASAYLNPILGTASKNITAVSGQILKGYVFAADSTPQIKYYPIGSGTPQTSISAQTVYIPLGDKYQIERVDVVFGEPLASGDSMSIQLKTDEDTTAIEATASALTASYATDGAIRRKSMKVTGFTADEQISVVVNFVAGACKIKRIEVFGSPVVIL